MLGGSSFGWAEESKLYLFPCFSLVRKSWPISEQ